MHNRLLAFFSQKFDIAKVQTKLTLDIILQPAWVIIRRARWRIPSTNWACPNETRATTPRPRTAIRIRIRLPSFVRPTIPSRGAEVPSLRPTCCSKKISTLYILKWNCDLYFFYTLLKKRKYLTYLRMDFNFSAFINIIFVSYAFCTFVNKKQKVFTTPSPLSYLLPCQYRSMGKEKGEENNTRSIPIDLLIFIHHNTMFIVG